LGRRRAYLRSPVEASFVLPTADAQTDSFWLARQNEAAGTADAAA
jgi:hypothetical protein